MRWMAAEQFNPPDLNSPRYTPATDVWSLGMTLYVRFFAVDSLEIIQIITGIHIGRDTICVYHT